MDTDREDFVERKNADLKNITDSRKSLIDQVDAASRPILLIMNILQTRVKLLLIREDSSNLSDPRSFSMSLSPL